MEIQNPMAVNQLFTVVGTFYRGDLTVEKAKKLFELEYGFIPVIEESKLIVTDEFCRKQRYPASVTGEALTYMKELQESGATNMMQCGDYIQNRFGYDRKQAKELLMVYIKDYTLIYRPWELL